jgi:hypothetical protein
LYALGHATAAFAFALHTSYLDSRGDYVAIAEG